MNQSYQPFSLNDPRAILLKASRTHSCSSIQKPNEQQEHPFKPAIHPLPKQLYPTATQISKEQILERLFQNRRNKEEEFRSRKIKEDEKAYQSACTFQPKINEISKKLGMDTGQVYERLYSNAIEKIKSTDVIELCNSFDKENCPFRPCLNPKSYKLLNSEKRNMQPIYKRLDEIIQQKREAQRRLEHQQEQKNIKFIPNQISQLIIKNKQDFKKDVLKRLFAHIETKNRKKQLNIQIEKQKYNELCPFQPTINKCSLPQFKQSFLERQNYYQQDLEEKTKLTAEATKCSFRPQTNVISSLLINAERKNQNLEDKINRLTYESLIQRQNKILKMEQSIYGRISFQPQINQISKKIDASHRNHNCDCHRKEQIFDFKPKINPKSRQLTGRSKSQLDFKDKQSVVKKLKKKQQYKELKQCSFKPITNARHRYFKGKQLKNVQGISSYLSKVEKSRNKKEEAEKIKQALFHLQSRYQQRKHTVPQEFHLSQVSGKLGKLKQQQQQRLRESCPFRPRVNDIR